MDAVGTSSGGSESSGERGSVLPLLVVVMAVAVAAVLALVAVTEAVVGRAEAQAAADAAALAGVVEGERGADDVAVRNGAVLTAFERRGAVVEVEVASGGRAATAWARWELNVAPEPARSIPPNPAG